MTVYHPFDARAAQLRASAFPGLVQADGSSFPVSGYAFDASTEEAVYFKLRAAGYGVGNVTVDIDWYADTATTGNVMWGAQLSALTPSVDTQDAETDSLPTVTTVTSAAGASSQRMIRSTIVLTGTALDSLADGDDVTIRLSRVAANAADTMAGDAICTFVTVSYPDGATSTGVYDVVANFGAIGNGTANDAPAIQAALTAAGNAGGGLVYLRAGTYGITTCLNVPSKVTVAGAGRGATVIKALSGIGASASPNGGYTMLAQLANPGTDITIRDLTVDGNYSATGITISSTFRENSGVVDFRGITRLAFRDIEVKAGWYYHLVVWDSTDVTVSRCHVTGPGTSGTYDQCDGIHLVGCVRGTIADCHVDMGVGTDGDDGLVARVFPGGGGCDDIVMSGNTVRGGSNGSGIDLANSDGTLRGVTISGNTIWGTNHEAIATYWYTSFTGSTQDVTIVGNTIRDCGSSVKLGLAGQTPPYKNVLVASNVISRSGGAPAQASTTNSSNITTTGNLIGT